MLKAIRGIYRNGKIHLNREPDNISDNTVVIVTFLPSGSVDLSELGVDEEQAANLRIRLASFAEEWNSSEMDIYDNYDAVSSNG